MPAEFHSLRVDPKTRGEFSLRYKLHSPLRQYIIYILLLLFWESICIHLAQPVSQSGHAAEVEGWVGSEGHARVWGKERKPLEFFGDIFDLGWLNKALSVLCCNVRAWASLPAYPSPAIASTFPFTESQCLNVHLIKWIKWIMIIIICHFNDFQIWCWLWFSSA